MIWQLDSLDDWIPRLTSLLRPGGALVFDVPALYLGEPDEPGGGDDPLLLDLMTRLVSENAPSGRRESSELPPASAWRHRSEDVEAALCRAGLRYRTWEFRYRLTQAAYARWLSIPVTTEGLFAGVDAGRTRSTHRACPGCGRCALVQMGAMAGMDGMEVLNGAPVRPLEDATALLGDLIALQSAIERDGYLFVRGLVPIECVARLRRLALEHAQSMSWLDPAAPIDQAHVRLRRAYRRLPGPRLDGAAGARADERGALGRRRRARRAPSVDDDLRPAEFPVPRHEHLSPGLTPP